MYWEQLKRMFRLPAKVVSNLLSWPENLVTHALFTSYLTNLTGWFHVQGKVFRLGLAISIGIVLILLPAVTKQIHAQQWPPFEFRLIPAYEDNKITYRLNLSKQVDWTLTDVTIKILLPEGTRFLGTDTIPTIGSSFDGKEVTFFIPVFDREIETGDASFVVEVVDPTLTIFTTRAWISWEGDQPGDYLLEDLSFDRTQQSLNWEPPAASSLQLWASASITDGIITYFIYSSHVGNFRMWDLTVAVPLPQGTTYLSAAAPEQFTIDFDGREVSFSTMEVERGANLEPLILKVSAMGVTDPFVVTHAWATWKNSGRRVGRSAESQEEIRTGDIIVQPDSMQWVFSDMPGDVPLANYDVTSLAFEDYTSFFKLTFHTFGELGPLETPLDFRLYFDVDCDVNTGNRHGGIGADYRIRYKRNEGKADIKFWNNIEKEYEWQGWIGIDDPPENNMVALWIPYALLELEDNRQFCWVAEVSNQTTEFNADLPVEEVIPPRRLVLNLTPSGNMPPVTVTNTISPSRGAFIESGDIWQYSPGWSEPPPTWKTVDFDDTSWFSGPTDIGYGGENHATDLGDVTTPLWNENRLVMVQRTFTQTGVTLAVLSSGDVASVFMRYTFTVTHPTLLTQLTLNVDYIGGFATYLNGQEVVRRDLGEPDAPVPYDVLASPQTVSSSEAIDLSKYIAQIVSGTNVLAIQAHSADGENLSITPRLVWEFDPAAAAMSPTPLTTAGVVASAGLTTPLIITEISGKLAVPLSDDLTYNVHVFTLPEGREIAKIPNARQPHIRFDGQRVLINREGGGMENVYEYNFLDSTEKQVSDAPQDWYPFYDPWGNRVVYGNSELTPGADGARHPFIFVQCGLLPPHQESEQRCRDIPVFGVLVPAGLSGEIWGTHPVWTVDDMIVYKGCNSWAGFAACGIYTVPASSTKGFSNGFIPRQLTKDTSDIPSDTKGNLIAFTSRRDDNWEAYVMNLDGTGVKNVSNSPDSNDGLPTISPDGNWVAFVSDRSGQWAVWGVSIAVGQAKKLFDLPTDNPWGDGVRTWTNERISWGP